MPSPSSPSRINRKVTSIPSSSTPPSSSRLRKLVVILIFFTALLCGYYAYRVGKSKQEIAEGWRSVASLGRGWRGRGEGLPQQGAERDASNTVVETHMNALAEALGIPVNVLAAAVANAVRADGTQTSREV